MIQTGSARTRDRSIGATRELVSIAAKYAADATAMIPVVTWERFDSLTTPVSSTAATTTTPATATPTTRPIPLRGSGFGTSRPCIPRLRRKTTYCASPAAIPMAAAPKP